MVFSSPAWADKPVPWQIGLQEAATPVMHQLTEFHHTLLIIIFAIGIFVMLLLAYVIIRFNAKANPVPSKTTHNTLLEILWTAVPVVVLVYICIPSMRTLYYNETIENAEMTLKVIGNQWYWNYEYPDQGGIAFSSNIIPDEEIDPAKGQIRLLSVDNKVVLPVDTTIRVQVTGADVIHNWAVPAFAMKIDAVPGRLNEGWIRIDKEGTYYGQCSELCGIRHGFMPIQVEAVSKEAFNAWVAEKRPASAEAPAANAETDTPAAETPGMEAPAEAPAQPQ